MSIYTVHKKSGTYSELLETYGLANLLHNIFDSVNLPDNEIVITDKGYCFEVCTSIDITDDIISKVKYFPPFKYIKQKEDSDVSKYPDYFDYPKQKDWKDEWKALNQAAYRISDRIERDNEIKRIKAIFETEKPMNIEYDVYSQILSKKNDTIGGFEKLYLNFHNNKNYFSRIINSILSYYQGKQLIDDVIPIFKKTKSDTITAYQFFNPNQGQGLREAKAKISRKNFDALWISETMKISGALSDMICQLVKVGSSYDLKIFVPEYKQLTFQQKNDLIVKFKTYTKGDTPIKIDVLYILLLTKTLIENTGFSGRRRKVKDIVSGLHSVYQKDMGKKRSVANIGFIQIPNFIEIGTKQDVQEWVEILQEQMVIIGKMKEKNDATPGLMMYRDFISGSNINDFFKFSYWYAEYLMSQLSKQDKPKAFTINTLNKLYNSMDNQEISLKSIIENEGFKAVADAIRKSTVSLQYLPKDQRKYEIRYGVAQALQTKSKTKSDLAEYIGEFISLYNAETSRKAEKDDRAFRKNVREDKLSQFYELLDSYSSKLIGALLASYGFALLKKTQSDDDEDNLIEDENEQ